MLSYFKGSLRIESSSILFLGLNFTWINLITWWKWSINSVINNWISRFFCCYWLDVLYLWILLSKHQVTWTGFQIVSPVSKQIPHTCNMKVWVQKTWLSVKLINTFVFLLIFAQPATQKCEQKWPEHGPSQGSYGYPFQDLLWVFFLSFFGGTAQRLSSLFKCVNLSLKF